MSSLVETLTTSLLEFFYFPFTAARSRIAHARMGEPRNVWKIVGILDRDRVISTVCLRPINLGRDRRGREGSRSRRSRGCSSHAYKRERIVPSAARASDGDGGFCQSSISEPGRYGVAVHADGFADYEVSSFQLDARQSLRLEVALKLATSTQTVEVSGETGPLINTESATIGDSKSFQQITGLPVNYRGATTSPLAMLATVPGAQQDANGNVSIGGGLPSQVQYSVDGSSTVNVRQNGALGNMNPSSELIGEFRVTQFNNNAEFAQLGDVTITTKMAPTSFTAASSNTRRIPRLMPRSGTPVTNLIRPLTPLAAVSAAPWRFPSSSMANRRPFLRRLRRQSPPVLHSPLSRCPHCRHAPGRISTAFLIPAPASRSPSSIP